MNTPPKKVCHDDTKGYLKGKGVICWCPHICPNAWLCPRFEKSIKWVSFSWLLSYLQLLTAACFGLSSWSIRGFNPSESTIGFLAHAAPAAMGRPSDTSVLSGLTCPVHRAGFFNAKKWPFNQKVTDSTIVEGPKFGKAILSWPVSLT